MNADEHRCFYTAVPANAKARFPEQTAKIIMSREIRQARERQYILQVFFIRVFRVFRG
jgi:hypothetical protein